MSPTAGTTSRPFTTAPTQSQTSQPPPLPATGQPRSSSLTVTSAASSQNFRTPSQQQPQVQPPQPLQLTIPNQPQGAAKEGVWADLVSLQEAPSSSTLPLQYSSPMMTGLPNQYSSNQYSQSLSPSYQPTGMNAGYNSAGVGGFQQMPQQFTSNPFGQQSSATFPPTSFTPSMTGVQPFQPTSSWGAQQSQALFGGQGMVQSPMQGQQMQFQQQPQQPILSPHAQFGGSLPVGTQYHTPSPQPFMQSTTPQPMGGPMLAGTPQPPPFQNGAFSGGYGQQQQQPQMYGQQATGYPNMMGQGQWGGM